MSRLVIVSNRVADLDAGAQSGGLAVAIVDALRDTGGIWLGWNGEIVPDGNALGFRVEHHDGISVATGPLSVTEYERYYLGYANKVLWPVFHYRLDLAEFEPEALLRYRAVNRRFASAVTRLVEPGDLLWVHDYHLIPLAAALREQGVTNRIGFFLHIPFPAPEIVTAIPDHDWLIDCLFAYDVVGFQADQHLDNFHRYLEQTGGAVTGTSHPFRAAGRDMVAGTYPIGIDVDAFAAMARTEKAQDTIRRLHRGFVDHHVIGVDRLDYSKGLPDRLTAFRKFLRLYPEHLKRAILMQIAQPTRERLTAYAEIRSELEQLSGAINGEFGDFDWTPVRYIHRSVARDNLAALLRGSNVGLVTPLRDGMNLVAKEYVAAQDETNPGVLVLSQFAGAAADLTDAVIVNPYDTDEVAHALNRAVTMEEGERRERHRSLLEQVRRHDAASWWRAFLTDLGQRSAAH